MGKGLWWALVLAACLESYHQRTRADKLENEISALHAQAQATADAIAECESEADSAASDLSDLESRVTDLEP